MEEEEPVVVRAKSFRDEDYNNRRVFLRSYPLHWDAEDRSDEDMIMRQPTSKINSSQKRPMRKMMVSMFQWGEGRVLVLRRFKHKVSVYVVSCIPVSGYRSSSGVLISS
ncbi:hypothetical protein LINGRAHAP2_LOCUS36958 [Linum grandiflorum]